MAAALAKVLRGGRSCASSALIVSGLPCCGHESSHAHGPVVQFLATTEGFALPEAWSSLTRTEAREDGTVRQQEVVHRPWSLPWPLLGITGAISMAYMISYLVESLWKRYTEEDDYSASPVDDK